MRLDVLTKGFTEPQKTTKLINLQFSTCIMLIFYFSLFKCHPNTPVQLHDLEDTVLHWRNFSLIMWENIQEREKLLQTNCDFKCNNEKEELQLQSQYLGEKRSQLLSGGEKETQSQPCSHKKLQSESTYSSCSVWGCPLLDNPLPETLCSLPESLCSFPSPPRVTRRKRNKDKNHMWSIWRTWRRCWCEPWVLNDLLGRGKIPKLTWKARQSPLKWTPQNYL